jgi:hypothetical protein
MGSKHHRRTTFLASRSSSIDALFPFSSSVVLTEHGKLIAFVLEIMEVKSKRDKSAVLSQLQQWISSLPSYIKGLFGQLSPFIVITVSCPISSIFYFINYSSLRKGGEKKFG